MTSDDILLIYTLLDEPMCLGPTPPFPHPALTVHPSFPSSFQLSSSQTAPPPSFHAPLLEPEDPCGDSHTRPLLYSFSLPSEFIPAVQAPAKLNCVLDLI